MGVYRFEDLRVWQAAEASNAIASLRCCFGLRFVVIGRYPIT